MSVLAAAIVSSGEQVIGWVTMPASERLTMSTCAAWSSTERLRCSTPTPPWRAIAIAIRASVTVSIALDSKGVRRRSDRQSRVEVSTSLGITSDAAGDSSTSSNVSPSRANFGGRPPSSEEKPGVASITPTREGRKAPSYGRCEHRPGTDAAAYGGPVADDAPLDPFAGDPADPAAGLRDDDDDLRPLSVEEREDVLADLEDLEIFQALLEPRAVRGLVVECQDCEEPHYFEWDLLRGNLKRLLDQGQPKGGARPGSAARPGAGLPAGSGGVRLVGLRPRLLRRDPRSRRRLASGRGATGSRRRPPGPGR